VDWQSKKVQENSVSALHAALMETFGGGDAEASAAAVAEHGALVPPEERVRVIWTVLVKSMNTVGKNQLQIQQMILRSIKANKVRPLVLGLWSPCSGFPRVLCAHLHIRFDKAAPTCNGHLHRGAAPDIRVGAWTAVYSDKRLSPAAGKGHSD
jgi:hypothetical protein